MDFTKRQLEIIEATTTLIGNKGIQNLTTKNLAQQMSFSEPALYRHFKNKTELLKSVLLYYKSQLKTKLLEIIAADKSGMEKIKAMILFQFTHFHNNPAIIMVIFSETSFQYDSILSSAVAEIMTQKRAKVSTILKEGQADGSVRSDIEATQLANIIMGSMRFTILRWRLEKHAFDLVKEGEILNTTIEKLIQKS